MVRNQDGAGGSVKFRGGSWRGVGMRAQGRARPPLWEASWERTRRGTAGTGTCPPTVVGGVGGEGAAWECGHRDVPAHLGQVL